MDIEDKVVILKEKLRDANNRLLYLDQLRPLIEGTCGGGGYMNKISFEEMSEYARLWMQQEGIE